MCGTGNDFNAVRDPIPVQKFAQLTGIEAESVYVAEVHRDGAILLHVDDVPGRKALSHLGAGVPCSHMARRHIRLSSFAFCCAEVSINR